MKIKILEYKVHRGNNVRVQSHNKIKGKWKINKNFEHHKNVVNNAETVEIYDVKESTMEVKE